MNLGDETLIDNAYFQTICVRTMRTWNSLLETLHSAWIDELVERHPDPKPELGLPSRRKDQELPESGLTLTLEARIELEGRSGAALLAMDSAGKAALGVELAALWSALLERSRPELERRGIAPRFGAPAAPAKGPAKGAGAAAGQTIWYPARLGSGRCFLGVRI